MNYMATTSQHSSAIKTKVFMHDKVLPMLFNRMVIDYINI